MIKRLVSESLAERKQRGIQKAPDEIKLNKDFIWNEVVGWLIEYLKTANTEFTYNEASYGDKSYLIFENVKGIKFFCERHWSYFEYGNNPTIEFAIGREKIFSYRIAPYHFKDPKYFVSTFQSGKYKDYAIKSNMVNGQHIKGGIENYKNLPNKRKLWKNRIDTKEYLKDTSFQAIDVNEKTLTYEEAIALPKLIIKTLKADEKFKAFLKGKDEETAKKAAASKALKGELSVDTVVRFLASTKPEHKTLKSDHAGPHATTGTSEFIDKWNISKLSQKFPDFEGFIAINIDKIFKGLQKNIYSHPLGYYTFIDYYVDDAILEIQASSTTYYN
jgi:hypothetical protein